MAIFRFCHLELTTRLLEKVLDEYEEAREDDDVYFSFHQIQVVDD